MTDRSPRTSRPALTLAVLLALAAALLVALFRPGRASLWPTKTSEWLSGVHGPIGLDEPTPPPPASAHLQNGTQRLPF
jgi:hypothetical protein